MANDAFLQHVPIPAAQIHYINTTISPELSEKEYEEILHTYFNDSKNTFDLTLLGMGEDGHTLSLFPGYETIFESEHWVKSFYSQEQQMYRITLTAPLVNRSSKIIFFTTGEKKSTALKNVLIGKYDPEQFPSQVIKPISGELHWFVDEAAASLLL